MSQELQLKTIEQNLSPLSDRAGNLVITDDKTMKEAVSLLSQLNQINDRIVQEREKVTKPLNEALKAERARWKPTELANTTAIDHIRAEMTRYQTALINITKQAEQSIASKVASGYIKLDTAVQKLEALPTISKNVATDSGDVQFREKKQITYIDSDIIPRDYLIPDEKLILESLKLGNKIAGVELETIQVPVNYR